MNGDNSKELPQEAIIYAFSHVETYLEDYARSHKLPAHELTGRVAGLLLAQTGGALLGLVDHMSALRRQTPQRNSPPREVEVVSRPHNKTPLRVFCNDCNPKRSFKDRAKMMRHKIKHHPKFLKSVIRGRKSVGLPVTRKKRKLNAAQIEAMRRNIALARVAKSQKALQPAA